MFPSNLSVQVHGLDAGFDAFDLVLAAFEGGCRTVCWWRSFVMTSCWSQSMNDQGAQQAREVHGHKRKLRWKRQGDPLAAWYVLL